jgi:uncharacterized damage-inducible protein DinB
MDNALLASSGLSQSPDLTTPVGYARAVQAQVRDLLTRTAEKMPSDQYAFRPTPDVRSFAQILGHVIDAHYMFCSAVLDERAPVLDAEKTKSTKSQLTVALKDVLVYGDKAYTSLTIANASDIIKGPGGGRARLGLLSFNSTHAYEHYGNLVTYLRLKGIVPPSSERRD